eukprot:TRINITY_DN67669_c0_g1_i1.p1 TRINITY_DN67669_c0_g1~~TRINITY_DN67669_c0_g1_i1.p1  ORF type:complete len:732 (-),score=131.39 TRINITY_DN67669_c0_g1_i1:386-2581(-)
MPFVSQNSSPLDGGGALRPGSLPLQRTVPRSDVVLVFPYKTSALVRWGDGSADEESRGLRKPKDDERKIMEHWKTKRAAALTALGDSGLVLMPFYSRDRDEIFVKVSGDEQHLRQVAEMKRHKLELKKEYLSSFAEYKNDYAGKRELNYRDRRVASHLYKAHVNEVDEEAGEKYPKTDAIFRITDRIQLIDYIIRSSGHNCAAIDIGSLMHERDLIAYFPLHENEKLTALDKDWFKAFAWGTHIHKVRDYFGERVALYFLFLSHMNKWLVFLTIYGITVCVIDFICNALLRTYLPSVAQWLPVTLRIGMGLWPVCFIHFWRRTAATYAVQWGTLGLGKQLEPTRLQFEGVSKINPVTGRRDRWYPWSKRIWKVLFSYAVLGVSLLLLINTLLLLFFLRKYFHSGNSKLTFMILNALVVETVNWMFTQVAVKLTERENHRSYTEHANHLLAKTVLFKFINSYSSLYFIAFFKATTPVFGTVLKCEDNDCLTDLGMQLAVFMVLRLTLLNFVELCVPAIKNWYRNYKEGRTFHTSLFTNPSTVMPDLSSAEKQCKKDELDLFQDSDEILILYGFTTLFVVACPWVPLLALISNMLEVFLDSKKLVMLYRRPFPQPAANNEPWDTAFDVFGFVAVFTNALVIVFTSGEFAEWSNSDKVKLFIVIEHLLIAARVLVGLAFPALPREIQLLTMQQEMIIHKHMNLGGEEDDHETRANAMRTTVAPAPYIHDQDEDY